MFNSTHTLVGLSAARSGLDKWAPSALWTALIAANLPDIDIVAEFRSTADYLAYHRGLTHSLIGIPFLSAALALGMCIWKRESFFRHFAVALLVMCTHPALDYLNSYGVHPFSPFKNTWYYGDILFVIDPYLDLLLLAGLLLAWKVDVRKGLAVWLSIAVALGYIGFRVELRDMARVQLARYSESLPDVQSIAVSPQLLNPFVLTGIVRTASETRIVDVEVFHGATAELARVSNAPENRLAAVNSARESRSGKILDAFARFPVATVAVLPGGYRVDLVDLQFYRPGLGRALAARVDLDQSLHVRSESIDFTEPISLVPAP